MPRLSLRFLLLGVLVAALLAGCTAVAPAPAGAPSEGSSGAAAAAGTGHNHLFHLLGLPGPHGGYRPDGSRL